MAEPQPSSIQEGAADPHAPTSTVEDRKAAAALSALDELEDSAGQKDVDGKALDKAMKGLSAKGAKGEEKKSVKVEAGDVALLVSSGSRMRAEAANVGPACLYIWRLTRCRRLRSSS